MTRDFTLYSFRRLLDALRQAGYAFVPFEEYVAEVDRSRRIVVLRHDVDKKPQNSLRFAQIQHEVGIRGTYYFRIVKQSFDPVIIRQIADLGHEIGYHYEDLALAGGDLDKAYITFQQHLQTLRKLYPIKTICMHGSPLSRYDNRKLWHRYDYRDLGLSGEPYFDVDFSFVGYLTDTGRQWNAGAASRRDRVESGQHLGVRTTNDIIARVKKAELPEHLMITMHPQRWSDDFRPWFMELVSQNVKNVLKTILYRWDQSRLSRHTHAHPIRK